jgi:hypothetical protein
MISGRSRVAHFWGERTEEPNRGNLRLCLPERARGACAVHSEEGLVHCGPSRLESLANFAAAPRWASEVRSRSGRVVDVEHGVGSIAPPVSEAIQACATVTAYSATTVLYTYRPPGHEREGTDGTACSAFRVRA